MNCKCAFWVAICLGLIWLYVVAIDELVWLKRDQSFQLLWNGLSLSVPPSPIFRWPPPTFQMCIVQASQLFGDLCVEAHTYVIFVILLTPAPFSGDTKKTHQIQIFWHQKNTTFQLFTPKHTNLQYFDTCTACGACDKYQVWAHSNRTWYQYFPVIEPLGGK